MSREGGGYIPPSSPGSGLGWDRRRRVVKLAGVIGSDWHRGPFNKPLPPLTGLAQAGTEEGGWENPTQRLRCEVYVQRTPAEQPNAG